MLLQKFTLADAPNTIILLVGKLIPV